MSRLGDKSTIEIRRGKALFGALTALAALCVMVVVGIDTAPAQSSTLICVKLNKPRKGSVRIPSTGLCRGNERGLLLSANGPSGPQGAQGIQGSPGAAGGLSGHDLASASTGPTMAGSASQDVACPGVKRVTGGGFNITTSDSADSNKIIATSSFPLGTNTWHVGAAVVAGAALTPAATWTLDVWATCATPAP